MTFISFLGDERGLLASDQRVFGADEVAQLHSVVEQHSQLSKALSTQAETLERTRIEAQNEGRAIGIQEAKAEAANELAQRLVELHRNHTELHERLQHECAGLAVEIVRKIAGQIASPDWLLAQAVQAADELVDRPALTLRVHVDQQAAIQSRCESRSITRFVSVLGDTDVAEQACILETSTGHIEVDLETQLSRVLNMLADEKPRGEH